MISDILARLAKLEKWRARASADIRGPYISRVPLLLTQAKWKEHRQQKKEEKAKKRKLQENEEPSQ